MAPCTWISTVVLLATHGTAHVVRHRCPPSYRMLRVSPDNGPYNNRFDDNARAAKMHPDPLCDEYGVRPVDATGLDKIEEENPSVKHIIGFHGQPATWGRDEQECGLLLLPNRFYIAPTGEAGYFFDQAGTWKTKDGATLATWNKGLYPWQPDAVHVLLGSKLIFKEEQMWQSNDLPKQWPEDVLKWIFDTWADWDTLIMRDCRHALLYAIRISKADPFVSEIYDRAGYFIGRTTKRQDVANSLVFYDEHDLQLAVAQTPMVSDAWRLMDDGAAPPVSTSTNIDGWEVWFFDRTRGSASSLLLAQNRWVIAAIAQHRALAAADLDAQVNAGNIGPIRDLAIIAKPMIWRGAFAAVIGAILVAAFTSIHQVVFPPPPPKKDNRFVEDGVSPIIPL